MIRYLIAPAFLLLFLINCSTVEYDNPIDERGTNGDEIQKYKDAGTEPDQGSLEDEDGDGILNVVDPDWSLRPLIEEGKVAANE